MKTYAVIYLDETGQLDWEGFVDYDEAKAFAEDAVKREGVTRRCLIAHAEDYNVGVEEIIFVPNTTPEKTGGMK